MNPINNQYPHLAQAIINHEKVKMLQLIEMKKLNFTHKVVKVWKKENNYFIDEIDHITMFKDIFIFQDICSKVPEFKEIGDLMIKYKNGKFRWAAGAEKIFIKCILEKM
jgi:hypothetical protein